MPRPPALLLCLLLVLLARSAPAAPTTLARGTSHETVAHVITGARPGPTVFIVGGMHGDEPAGRRAAEQIRHWTVTRGLLVVLPSANVTGAAKGTRLVAGEPPYDLNRCFPPEKGAPVRGVLAASIWSLVQRSRPDWLLDLHESKDYLFRTSRSQETLGHTLICWPDGVMPEAAERLKTAVNGGTRPGKYAWQVLRHPIPGSLARAAAVRLGAHSAIVETCKKEFLATRVRHHRLVVHALLRELEMLPQGFSPDTYFPPDRSAGEIRVAIYNSEGTGSRSAWDVERCLPPLESAVYHRISAVEIRSGSLASFDVVVFPGGTGSGTAEALGPEGRAAVREFVREGGGFLGICAGAYLASNQYPWSLGILDAKVVDRAHWARGIGSVRIDLTEPGQALLRARSNRVLVHYAQGPLLAAGIDPDIPDFETLATYGTEVTKNGAPKGVMVGTPAIVRGRFGEGRVLAMSPHPEQTEGLHGFVRAAVRWLAD